jgi:alpha-L-rhamnosidase
MSLGFRSALPVWPADREREMNRIAGFRAAFDLPAGRHALLRITSSAIYRVFINGEFLGCGPVRAPHGMFRVDEWQLSNVLLDHRTLLAIEVSSYNINTYYQLNQPAFLQAEVVAGKHVIASTGGDGIHIEGRVLGERVQRVERYSVARGFSEVYRLYEGYDRWRYDPSAPFSGEGLRVGAQGRILPRRIPYPRFGIHRYQKVVSCGRVRSVVAENIRRDWTLTHIGPDLLGFREEELDVIPSIDFQKMAFQADDSAGVSGEAPCDLGKDAYRILDFGLNRSGFIGFTVRSAEPVCLYAAFDEILTDGDVDCFRLRCVNILRCDLQPGDVSFESFEPYTLRYLKLFTRNGRCTVTDVYLREYASAEGERARFHADDQRLNLIFEAGRETLRQNTVDLFTDCPSRERAGWLCDSFFLGRTAERLYGNVLHEKNYLENYLLPAAFSNLPAGMLPMCFPADHDNGNFIPNWALWFVLQLEEYLGRSGDRDMIDAFRDRVLKIFDYFRKYENEDGLLENLDGWVFVEWSMANEFVKGVNYPTNMLYAAALRVAGRLYEMPDLLARAESVAGKVLRQSFDGEFFVDNALRREGTLVRTENRTEICQYHAFYFGIASPEAHAALWERLVREFGVGRVDVLGRTGVHPANALLGLPLRFELLSRYGNIPSLVADALALYEPMAIQTGTLWEHVGPAASCCHGFASHIAYVLYRDILGLYRIDRERKQVHIRLRNSGVHACGGEVPVAEGVVGIDWQKEGGTIRLRIGLPAGYSASVENQSGCSLVRADYGPRQPPC